MRLGLDVRLTYYTGGGIARYIQGLATWLPQLAPEHQHVHFYRRGHPAHFAPTAARRDCWTPAHHRWERYALSLELLPHRLDLLHSPDFIPPLAGYRRSVITVHDLTFLHYPQFLTAESRQYYNAQIRWAVQRTDAILADSAATQVDLVNLLQVPPEKITVVHLGLDPEEFKPLNAETVQAHLTPLGLRPGYVLFVGTFEPRKNVPGLLTAYAALRAAWPDVPPLVLVGRRGWLFEAAEKKVAELQLQTQVRFLPEVPGAALPALYNGASVLVLPSHYEGFGFPVLEAMACGTPVVIANRASLPEIAGDAALAIDPDDTPALTEALSRALSDSTLRATLQQRGLARAAQFRWETTAAQTLAVYEKAGK